MNNRLTFYLLFFAVLVVYLVGYDRLVHSRYGLAFDALREDELAAQASGIDVVRYKTLAGFLGSLMIGLVGILYGFSEGYMSPSTYSFNSVDVLVLIMLILGGMRTLLGPVVGAVFILSVNEALAGTGGWRTFVFGVLLVVLFLYFREGIVPKAREVLAERGVTWESALDRAT